MKDSGEWIVNPLIELLEITHVIAVEHASGEAQGLIELDDQYAPIIDILHRSYEGMNLSFQYELGDVGIQVTFRVTKLAAE